jgi:hypothetical protein
LTAKDKLAEARFFLDKMRKSDRGTWEFKFYASACTSAMYSSFQHLLYDYARKYWPSLTMEDRLDLRSLQVTAKATGHQDALLFCDWYDKASQRIKSNPDTAEIWQVRHTGTHRDTPPLDFHTTIFQPIDVTDRLEYGVMSPSGSFQPSGSMPPSDNDLRAVEGSRVGVFFAGYRVREVLAVFESALPFIDSLIREAEKKFGSP